jgi:hypothetical protein
MNNSTTPTSSQNPPSHIKQELLDLCDSYKQFHHCCAAYSKSSSALMRSYNVDLDEDCTEGMAHFAQTVIEQS